MFKNKKSWMSVATALALTSSVVSAGYLPLTTTANDNQWMLFGVSGFKNDGGSEAIIGADGEFTVADEVRNVAIDNTADSLYGSDGAGNEENGMYTGATTEGGLPALLGKVKNVGTGAYIEVRVDTTGIVFQEGDPERTMYITDADGNAAYAFTYKAVLEGKRLEYSTVDSANPQARFITISAQNTFSNPAVGELILGSTEGGETGTLLKTVTEAIDYDFSDNPSDSNLYATDTHQQVKVADQGARLYSYDTENADWRIYDSANSAAANDFDTFVKGKGYWGRIDTGVASTESGFVFAKNPSITTADYEAAGLTDGWNLIAFDGQAPDVRIASTGLLATLAGANDVTIKDASGVFSVTIANADLTGAGSADADAAVINSTIAAARKAGTLPRTFKMFAVASGADDIIILSNEKFILEGTDFTGGAATTLAGQASLDAALTTATATGEVSIYGEYFMFIEPNNTLADAAFEITTIDNSTTPATKATDLVVVGAATSNTVTNIDAAANTSGDTSAYAVTADGKDMVLIASRKPFYLRDHTFTRAFTYSGDTSVNTDTVTIMGLGATAEQTITLDPNTAVTDVVTDLAAGTDINAVRIGLTDNLVIYSSIADAASFQVVETAGENLTPLESVDADEVKGAIKGLYSANYFADLDLTNEITLTLPAGGTGEILDADATVDVILDYGVTTILTVNFTTGVAYDLSDATERGNFLAALVDAINTEIEDNYLTATVSYDATARTITIDSPDVDTVNTFTYDNGTAGDYDGVHVFAENVGILPTISPDLVRDLKFNTVYAPNYVLNGPLYAMKEAGFAAKAFITGTMNLASDTVKWDSIDLTNAPSDWFSFQEYNLYSVDSKAGYWAYLETDNNPNPLTIADPYFSASYTQHFDVNGIAYNYVSGNLEITIEGLPGYDERDAVRVSANVGGSDVELSAQYGSNNYTGRVSNTELHELTRGSEREIFVNVADGLGYRLNNVDTGLVVDYKKPTKPTVTFIDGAKVTIASTSDDVAKFYIYNAATIPTGAAADNATPLFTPTVAEAAELNVCAPLTRGTSYDFKVIALDGGGTRATGNASDVYALTYVPTFKNAMVLVNSRDGEVTPPTTTEGNKYDANCENPTPETDQGLSISTITDGKTSKISFLPDDAASTDKPHTIYLENSVGDVMSIMYAADYIGQEIFYQVGSEVYRYTLIDTDPLVIGDLGHADTTPAIGTLVPGMTL
jgi:hypothetical protein